MANLRDIRRRIKSVKSTAQITKAMQMVAASKMKKAQDQALAGRAYADELNSVLTMLRDKVGDELEHPLLKERPVARELILVISTDRGLCGPLNTNLGKRVFESFKGKNDQAFITVGQKLRRVLAKSSRNLVADFTVKDPVPFADMKRIARLMTDKFMSGEVDRVRVIFTNYINTLRQEATEEILLPISPMQLGGKRAHEDDHAYIPKLAASATVAGPAGVLFEPDPLSVLNTLLPQYINFAVYQMALEARASEHSARMVAMKSATDNAKQMIKDLSLEYNKLRQAAITNELLEITTAQKALE